MIATKNSQSVRDAAIAAEIERLRKGGYGAEIGGWTTIRNGRRLSIEELATLNVDEAKASGRRIRAMCDERKAPGAQTEREFFAGHSLFEQYKHEPMKLEAIVRKARAKGYNPTGKELYMEPAERSTDTHDDEGNPDYFISEKTGGRAHLKRLRRECGLSEKDS